MTPEINQIIQRFNELILQLHKKDPTLAVNISNTFDLFFIEVVKNYRLAVNDEKEIEM